MLESYYSIERMANEHVESLRNEVNANRQIKLTGCRTNLFMKLSGVKTAAIIIPMIIGLLYSCTITPLLAVPLDNAGLKNGTYQGFYEGGLNSALVEISILDQKIIDAAVLEHNTLLGKKAEDIIISEILEAQSTEVDSVSGATNSSHVIINAARLALEKAFQG